MNTIFGLWVLVSLPVAASADADAYTVEQVVQHVVDTHGALAVSDLQVERATLERPQVESGLGWIVGGQSGASHDVSFIGTPSDSMTAGASAERLLRGGASVGVNASYSYEDSSMVFSPALPNPAHSTRLDLSYRMPLRKGRGNPGYFQGLTSADAGVEMAEADRRAQRDQLARQTVDLFYNIAATRTRILNAKRAIERAQRLQSYVLKNADLGLAEDKDLLQVTAQLRAQTADHLALEVAWKQQQTALNRFMGRDWNDSFVPEMPEVVPVASLDSKLILDQVEQNNPDLIRLAAQVRMAEAAIARARDAKLDTLDVVVAAGTRTRSGDSAYGPVSKQDVAGAIRLEYRRAMDQRGFDAKLAQAQLDRSIALERMQVIKEDLRYQVASMVAEIDAAAKALEGYRVRLDAEERKFNEAEGRYRTGRADTQQLIQFESERYFTQLAVEQQRIELARKLTTLDLLRGKLWDRVVPLEPLQSARKGAN